jgi:hypothetical protein
VSTAWPEGVIARYLTVGGANVDITVQINHDNIADEDGLSLVDISHLATCTGCGSMAKAYSDRGIDDTEQARRTAIDLTSPKGLEIKEWAQSHAEECRAMPRPEGAK